ncbi:ribosomal l7/l12 50s ribonucleoprotein chloroplast l12 plastid direct sequencing peptide [Lucifera butyrica]|uniref:Ribosomal l7/l12 50s ribonucleoprotein chloroplast l12 plastid direct sequencing peptide n=1 Tax=Lucifera butyrica TaxID=1351585 RepID=A0A498R4U6_9FIRM|nr:ribosomal protein L7/L12 [Lucifera butyrica]VBB07716.1 ribosomal l7/l12 50s ribonucleoprotein chloroplast l12 plastid direct sequencing peptide [Lucifera butyrica]
MSLITARCTNCGKEIQLDDAGESGFCLYCGTKVMLREVVQKNTAEFDLILVNAGPNKISTINVIRDIAPRLGLKKAKDLVDMIPSIIQAGVSYKEAEASRLQFANVGAQVEIVAAGSKKLETPKPQAQSEPAGNSLIGTIWHLYLGTMGIIVCGIFLAMLLNLVTGNTGHYSLAGSPYGKVGLPFTVQMGFILMDILGKMILFPILFWLCRLVLMTICSYRGTVFWWISAVFAAVMALLLEGRFFGWY